MWDGRLGRRFERRRRRCAAVGSTAAVETMMAMTMTWGRRSRT
jgi:hypothetical protein